MPSKALLCLLAAGAAAKNPSVSQVLKDIGSLLQQRGHADLINKIKITPGVDASLTDGLNQVVRDIEANVEPTIKASFDSTQTAIDTSINDLTAATTSAVSSKTSADTSDSTWFACVQTEKSKREAVEAAEGALADANEATKAPCQLQESLKPYSWAPAPGTDFQFSCDHSQSGLCDTQFTNYRSQILGMVDSLKADESAAAVAYSDAEKACTDAWSVVAEAESSLDAATQEWTSQKEGCIENHEARQVAMCLFGTELQRKCGKVNAYESLMGEIDTENGGAHSHPDRVAEWSTTHTTKCLLSKIAEGAADFSSALTTCEASVNYPGDVGTLDRKGSTFADLTTTDNFTCQESSITFSGETWVLPVGDAPPSSGYVIEPFNPPVSLTEGSAPFAFCP